MTDGNGVTRTVFTTTFGYFTFTDVEVGETYTFQIFAKNYTFAPQVVSITDEITDLNFSAQ